MPTLTPAYGRDYKSAKAVKADYYGGKDFTFHQVGNRYDGTKCSCRDFIGKAVILRYNRDRRVTTATFNELDEARYSGENNEQT